MVANIEIRGVDSQSCHFIWGLMLGYYDVEDTWPQFNHTKPAHTDVLPDRTFKKWALSNFAFQHC